VSEQRRRGDAKGRAGAQCSVAVQRLGEGCGVVTVASWCSVARERRDAVEWGGSRVYPSPAWPRARQSGVFKAGSRRPPLRVCSQGHPLEGRNGGGERRESWILPVACFVYSVTVINLKGSSD
jgi:hypothetical protein